MLFYDWPIGPYMGTLRPMYHYRTPSGKPPVRHQQTCPVCGRKLVNTYFRDGVWKCRRCWEELNHADAEGQHEKSTDL
ncbi:MAG: hypothetical protein HDT20_04355 [Oscillibacter sp.]|nr:hypothetical protein [Oscillibacter sp.]